MFSAILVSLLHSLSFNKWCSHSPRRKLKWEKWKMLEMKWDGVMWLEECEWENEFGWMKFEIYNEIWVVIVIKIWGEDGVAPLRDTTAALTATPFSPWIPHALVFWWISPDFQRFKSASICRRQENAKRAVSGLTTTLASILLVLPFSEGSGGQTSRALMPTPATFKLSGTPPSHIPTHSCAHTHLSVAEYNYLVR